MTTATKQQTPTAAQAYEGIRNDIARVLDWLDLELERHAADAKNDPRNWGHAGELGGVKQRLVDALACISGNDEAAIEDLLREQD